MGENLSLFGYYSIVFFFIIILLGSIVHDWYIMVILFSLGLIFSLILYWIEEKTKLIIIKK
jgi:hypothetical protein